MEQLLYWNNKYLLNYVDNERDTDLNEENLEDEHLEIPPSPSISPSPFHPVPPSPEIYSNDIPIQEPEEVKKNNIIENNISLVSQNAHSLRSDKQRINLDSTIDTMMSKRLEIYCILETWLGGNFIKDINVYTMIHHGLESQKCSRGQKGVDIILSSKFTKSYHESGSLPTIIPTDNNKEEYGRFIGLKFSLNIKKIEKGSFRKKKKKNLSIKKDFFVSSIYHQNDFENQEIFNGFLSSIFS